MAIIDAQGNVSDVQVTKPVGLGLDEKAVEAVRQWKFKPAVRNGIPVKVRVNIEVTFHSPAAPSGVETMAPNSPGAEGSASPIAKAEGTLYIKAVCLSCYPL